MRWCALLSFSGLVWNRVHGSWCATWYSRAEFLENTWMTPQVLPPIITPGNWTNFLHGESNTSTAIVSAIERLLWRLCSIIVCFLWKQAIVSNEALSVSCVRLCGTCRPAELLSMPTLVVENMFGTRSAHAISHQCSWPTTNSQTQTILTIYNVFFCSC